MNSVNLLGRLTRDPEIKKTDKTQIASFSVGFNDPYNKDKSNFIDCVCFGKTAETIGQYMTKGKPILLTGRLQQDKWVAKDGTNRSKIVLNVAGFTFVPKGGETKENNTPVGATATTGDIPF